MACKYKINGVWYSEEEVKSIFEQSEKKSKEYYDLVDKLESATPEEKQDVEAKIAELDKEFSVESKEELPSTIIPETTENVSTESLEVKPEVKKIFESNTELQSIGTVEQYSTYIDSIFPDYINNFTYEAAEEFLVANKIIDRKC